ncbi:MAG: WxcM-like domain-containing protein, partial [Flavobacteriaceae bacterium]
MITLIDIPKITDVRGNLGVVEKDVIPFNIKRVYYLYDV